VSDDDFMKRKFGLSESEQARITARAYADHIMEGMEDLFGNYRDSFVQAKWAEAADHGFAGQIEATDDDYPVHRGSVNGVNYDYHPGGSYIQFYEPGSDSPYDVAHVGYNLDDQGRENGHVRILTPDEVRQRAIEHLAPEDE
jgi:hypothetical protein